MTATRYQDVAAESIPKVSDNGTTVRVVADEVWGNEGLFTEIIAQPLYLDGSLAPGTAFSQRIRPGHTAIAYVFEGGGSFGESDEAVESVHLVMFGDGERLEAHSPTGIRFLLIAGAPFGEPIAPYGPFVMNTLEEIKEALNDLRNGTFVQPAQAQERNQCAGMAAGHTHKRKGATAWS